MNDLSGQSFGQYHLIEQLGEGGMAIVYKAFDTRLEREVAIKIIRNEKYDGNACIKIHLRFEREAKILAKLNHPNIVRIIDYGEAESQLYFVMDYLPGGTLKQKTGKPMPWREAAQLILPIARALEYAHQHKVIHRDVKPSNILLTSNGQPMLSDFGVAKILDINDSADLTGTGVGVGTPEYMAPEQGLGKPIDHRSDIYSLGIVFYELLTGRKPYKADTPLAVVIKQINDPLPRPIQFVPDLPKEIEQVVFKALAKNPADRFQDMGEFAAKLEILAKSEEKPTNLRLFTLSRKWLSIISIFLLFSVIVLISVISINQRRNISNVKAQNNPTSALPATTPPTFKPTIFVKGTISPTATNTPPLAQLVSWKQGKIAFMTSQSSRSNLELLNLLANSTQEIATSENELGFLGLAFSPDGESIAYYSYPKHLKVIKTTTGVSSQQIATCQSPSFSGDSSQILCVSDQLKLILIDASDGKQILQINQETQPRLAYLSSNSGQIVYTISRSGNTQIWRTSIKGEPEILLSGNASENYAPAWSPDGTQIAYQSNDGSSNSEIWVMDKDGKNKRRVTYTSNSGWSRAPSWSPDGEFLAYVSNQNGSAGSDKGEIFVISLQTGEIIQITDTGGQVYDWRVAWGK